MAGWQSERLLSQWTIVETGGTAAYAPISYAVQLQIHAIKQQARGQYNGFELDADMMQLCEVVN